jgi:hypothetical protein
MGNNRNAIKHKRGYKPTKRKSTSKGIKKTLGKQARDPTVSFHFRPQSPSASPSLS